MARSTFISIFALLALAVFPAPALFADDLCMECHSAFEEDDGPSKMFTGDVHFQKGLTCHDCHGGDPDADDMDVVRKSANYRGVPDHFETPEFCARCHSDAAYMHDLNPALPVDQLDKYKTSVHGIRLFNNKDRKVANCVSCHTAHQIGDPRMPHSTTYPLNLPFVCGACHADESYMEEYGIRTDQLELYKRSVHGMALLDNHDFGAPACNDCHGNHGASPPAISSLSAVCGGCHAIEAGFFAGSVHYEVFTENNLSMCEVCHSYHDIDKPSDLLVGWEDPAVCGDCHGRDDDRRITGIIDSMQVTLFNLTESAYEARRLLDEAAYKGMMTTDEEFLMKEVSQSLISARTAIHAFNIDSLARRATVGITKADIVRTQSAALIDEYHYRRRGLAIATFIITILAVALYLKIRRIEK